MANLIQCQREKARFRATSKAAKYPERLWIAFRSVPCYDPEVTQNTTWNMNTMRSLRSLFPLVTLVLFASFNLPANAAEKQVTFIIAEDEYKASESLPAFSQTHLAKSDGFKTTFLYQDGENKYSIPGMEKLSEADLVVMYVRRRSLPEKDMQHFRDYLASGKPLLALRTSSHAWDTRGRGPANQAEWKTFDPEVLGGNYHGHHGNEIESRISVVPGMEKHPILAGVNIASLVGKGSLYKAAPLEVQAQVLLIGTIPNQPAEPILWHHRYGQSHIVYTSLGHVGDFAQKDFKRLLRNTIDFLLAN